MKLSCLVVFASLIGTVGCGIGPNPNCVPKPYLSVEPLAFSGVDHAANPPENQVKFTVTEGVAYSSSSLLANACATPAVMAVVHPTWANPAPQQISISSANDSTNGVAVCLDSTNGPVTLTATLSTPANSAANIPAGTLTVSAQLTCK